MKITTPKTNFGYFGWRVTVDLTPEQLAYFAGLGVLQFWQRSPATSAEKALAGFEKRPEKFNRSSIDYNDGTSKTFKSEMSKPVEIVVDENTKFTLTPKIESWKHDLGATAEPKYADEKKIVQRHIDNKDIVDWARDTVGFTKPGTLDTDNVEFLAAVKAYKQARLAEV